MSQEKKRSISPIESTEHAAKKAKKAKTGTNCPTICQLFQIVHHDRNMEIFYREATAESVSGILQLHEEAVQKDKNNSKSQDPWHEIGVSLAFRSVMAEKQQVYENIPELIEEPETWHDDLFYHYCAIVQQLISEDERKQWKRIGTGIGEWKHPEDILFKVQIWCCDGGPI